MEDQNTIVETSWYVPDLNVTKRINTASQPIAVHLAPHDGSEKGYVMLEKIGGKNSISVTPEGSKIDGEDIYIFGTKEQKVSVKVVWDGHEWKVEDYRV